MPIGIPSTTLVRADFSRSLAAPQTRRTSSTVSARSSPKTCGWRRTIFSVAVRATSARSKPSPSVRAMSAWKTTWSSTSASSSRMPGTSSVSMASTSSWLSSSRYGTRVRCVICRFQAQPSGARRTAIAAASSATAADAASDPDAAADADGDAGSLIPPSSHRAAGRLRVGVPGSLVGGG